MSANRQVMCVPARRSHIRGDACGDSGRPAEPHRLRLAHLRPEVLGPDVADEITSSVGDQQAVGTRSRHGADPRSNPTQHSAKGPEQRLGLRPVLVDRAPDYHVNSSRRAPDLTRFDRGQQVQTLAVTEDSAIVELSRHDAVQQRVTIQVVTLDGDGVHLRPVAIRYSWPGELDLMARQAGLRLSDRYGGWDRRPFDSSSGQHISVYRRA
jgi:hypothetical protein